MISVVVAACPVEHEEQWASVVGRGRSIGLLVCSESCHVHLGGTFFLGSPSSRSGKASIRQIPILFKSVASRAT